MRQLVKLHGGTVTATSAGLGHGSEFEVRLPEDSPVEHPAPVAAPVAPDDLRKFLGSLGAPVAEG